MDKPTEGIWKYVTEPELPEPIRFRILKSVRRALRAVRLARVICLVWDHAWSSEYYRAIRADVPGREMYAALAIDSELYTALALDSVCWRCESLQSESENERGLFLRARLQLFGERITALGQDVRKVGV